jgi:hypothetical protein
MMSDFISMIKNISLPFYQNQRCVTKSTLSRLMAVTLTVTSSSTLYVRLSRRRKKNKKASFASFHAHEQPAHPVALCAVKCAATLSSPRPEHGSAHRKTRVLSPRLSL